MNSKDFSKKHLAIAIITSAHGIKGMVNVKTFTEKPEHIVNYGEIFNFDKTIKFKLKIHSFKKDKLVASIEGINDRTEAEKLANTKLYVDRDALPATTNDDEFYIEDLIDMDVLDNNNKVIGKVIYVHNFGGGNILEIQFNNMKNSEMLLFSKENFPIVDIENNQIIFLGTSKNN